MAFCMFCGKKLEDGEICDCQNQGTNQQVNDQPVNMQYSGQPVNDQPVNSQPVTNQQMNMQYNNQQMNMQYSGQPMNNQQMDPQQYQEKFNQAKEASGAYLQKLCGALLGIIKKPSEMGKQFVEAEDRKLAVGFLVMQAVLSSLFFLILFRKINSAVESAVSYLGDVDSKYLINMPKAFVLTMVGSLALSFAIAGLLYVGAKISKGTATFWNMVCAVSVRAVGTSIFVAAAILVAFLNLTWGIVIFALSALSGLIFLTNALSGSELMDENIMVYIICAVAILSIVVFAILCRILVPMYIPSGLTEAYEELLDQLKDLDSLSDWL
ncbi:MAG: hypothetical protein PUB10_01770 [Clostridiales bacterium]|nr:hypothetical protein [Clostridiales bacterium]